MTTRRPWEEDDTCSDTAVVIALELVAINEYMCQNNNNINALIDTLLRKCHINVNVQLVLVL